MFQVHTLSIRHNHRNPDGPARQPASQVRRTSVATAIHFGPAVTIGAAFGTWGWWFGSGFLWPSHAILIDHRPWERVWVGRGAYVHPYAHPWVHPVGPLVEVHHRRR